MNIINVPLLPIQSERENFLPAKSERLKSTIFLPNSQIGVYFKVTLITH